MVELVEERKEEEEAPLDLMEEQGDVCSLAQVTTISVRERIAAPEQQEWLRKNAPRIQSHFSRKFQPPFTVKKLIAPVTALLAKTVGVRGMGERGRGGSPSPPGR